MSAALPKGEVECQVSTTDILKEQAKRKDIALNAAYQVDATLNTLRRVQLEPGFELVLQAIMPRVKDLVAVIISALDGTWTESEELRAVVDRWVEGGMQS